MSDIKMRNAMEWVLDVLWVLASKVLGFLMFVLIVAIFVGPWVFILKSEYAGWGFLAGGLEAWAVSQWKPAREVLDWYVGWTGFLIAPHEFRDPRGPL